MNNKPGAYEIVKAVKFALENGFVTTNKYLMKDTIDDYTEKIRVTQYEKFDIVVQDEPDFE